MSSLIEGVIHGLSHFFIENSKVSLLDIEINVDYI